MAAVRFFITTLALLCLFSASKAQVNNISDLDLAMAEMKAGSYYGFVMLLQMMVESITPIPPIGEVTFLMPTDKLLADHTSLTINTLPNFLLTHSISQNLKFNNFLHFPTGSLIPSSLPHYMLTVSNYGRRNFSLNNAQIVSPNVCRASISIACHGISQVLTSPPPPPPLPLPPSLSPSPSASPSLPPPLSPSPVPQAHHNPPLPPPPPPPSAPGPVIQIAQPAPSPSPSSNEATPCAYTSVLLLFICAIVALAHP